MGCSNYFQQGNLGLLSPPSELGAQADPLAFSSEEIESTSDSFMYQELDSTQASMPEKCKNCSKSEMCSQIDSLFGKYDEQESFTERNHSLLMDEELDSIQAGKVQKCNCGGCSGSDIDFESNFHIDDKTYLSSSTSKSPLFDVNGQPKNQLHFKSPLFAKAPIESSPNQEMQRAFEKVQTSPLFSMNTFDDSLHFEGPTNIKWVSTDDYSNKP